MIENIALPSLKGPQTKPLLHLVYWCLVYKIHLLNWSLGQKATCLDSVLNSKTGENWLTHASFAIHIKQLPTYCWSSGWLSWPPLQLSFMFTGQCNRFGCKCDAIQFKKHCNVRWVSAVDWTWFSQLHLWALSYREAGGLVSHETSFSILIIPTIPNIRDSDNNIEYNVDDEDDDH